MVLGLGVAAATTIASIAAFPMIKDAWERFVNRPPPPPVVNPQLEEQYIAPTPPLPPAVPNNGHANGGQETPPPPQVEEPPQQQKEEEVDGLFHEAELRRKQKLMGQRPRDKYQSPFGKDVGGL